MACETCNGFGWMLDRNGNLEACRGCGQYDEETEAGVIKLYAAARVVIRELTPSAHYPTDECPGCPGFDLFECIGSRNQKRIAILRDDECGVFDSDDQAQRCALEAFRCHGGVVVDGH